MANFDKYVDETVSSALQAIRAYSHYRVLACKTCTLVDQKFLDSNVRVWYNPKTNRVVRITHG